MRIARLATVGFFCFGVAWGCGSSGDDDNGVAPEGGAGTAGSATGGAGGSATGGSTATGGSGVTTGGAAGSGATGTGGTVGGAGGLDGGVEPDASAGAGGSPPDGGGVLDATFDAPNITFDCELFGAPCTHGQECCSKLCDPVSNTCLSSTGSCTPGGGSCTNGTDCCTFRCEENGKCSASQCIDDYASCSTDGQCCSGTCSGGTCAPLNLTCKTSGNSCTGDGGAADSQCCSKYCNNGTCDIAPSWCVQTGDVCSRGGDCCSGRCAIADGASVGTCSPVWASGTSCANKLTDGEVCGGFSDCGSCCSKLCAPHASTGVFVCQPATGCRNEGSVCQEDRDCCGAAGTELPGDGNTYCNKPAGSDLGVCKSTSCSPQGDICKYDDYVCGKSTAPNNCCSAVGQSGKCQLDSEGVLRCNGFVECPAGSSVNSNCSLCMLDAIGIPRCNGLAECRQEGETCSSSLDCCDGLPCVVAEDGKLRCYVLPPGEECVPVGGPCTADADCCSGYTCIKELGSVNGTCGQLNPPVIQPDGGVVFPPPPPPPECSAYGQSCTITTDCCNPDAVPCTGGVCKISSN
jgi:hypothetical protein